MPPRQRDRPSNLGPFPFPSSPGSSAPRRSDISIDPLEATPPFFDVSFSPHRASPLHIGNEPLTTPRLNTLAQQFRNLLVGDVVRGVQVGLEGGSTDPSLARAGSLEYVSIRWFDVAALLARGRDDAAAAAAAAHDADRTGDTSFSELRFVATRKKGLCIDIEYENILYEALLLPTLDEGHDTPRGRLDGPFDGVHHPLRAPGSLAVDARVKSEEFLRLPLLLLRMPASLKTFVTDFLARTFDCRISPLPLGTRSIVSAWETWISNAGLPSSGPLAKDVALTLGFYVPGLRERGAAEANGEDADSSATATTRLGIRSLDIIIPAADLARFLREGQTASVGHRRAGEGQDNYWKDDARKRRKLAGGSSEEGWEWLGAASGDRGGDVGSKNPFTEALARYLDQHLALDLFHPGVQIAKIACAGFALSETRIKIFSHALGKGSEPGEVMV
ncbi:hypothetical protein SODALDRAFT_337265 [Sodiomyces alkalinus F11]|uniref:Siroheme synthase n=1 Tax=Sodiomyces alkalinus (strain CBS 110278 / VKM F-3762 / F11) TaxID=1314773 RepID=A0A3N2PNW6_SODAK|nr:hypothetical protein SODALDRAFT_337265 [Sodiomyces alkalinus F11]ROT36124.1 hypothetical protein SODALDRAFT_337265 [Sodiomyces alkalinus F11]